MITHYIRRASHPNNGKRQPPSRASVPGRAPQSCALFPSAFPAKQASVYAWLFQYTRAAPCRHRVARKSSPAPTLTQRNPSRSPPTVPDHELEASRCAWRLPPAAHRYVASERAVVKVNAGARPQQRLARRRRRRQDAQHTHAHCHSRPTYRTSSAPGSRRLPAEAPCPGRRRTSMSGVGASPRMLSLGGLPGALCSTRPR